MLLPILAQIEPSPMRPVDLRCEHLSRPLGVDSPKPRLSWRLEAKTKERALHQRAFRVLVASSLDLLKLDRGDLWDTRTVSSRQTVGIEYAGAPLRSRQTCYWKVMVWDQADRASKWSEVGQWTMGLLSYQDWNAAWLAAPDFRKISIEQWGEQTPSPLFRKEFSTGKKVVKAIASICGLGYYELRINGQKVGNHELDPVFTRYDKRCNYVAYDVTPLLKKENAIGVMLGNGWFNQWAKEEWNFHNAVWRAKPRFLLNLRLTYADGSEQDVVSDASWTCAAGPVLANGIRNGEVYDAGREQPGWDEPGFDARHWVRAEIVEAPKGRLVSQMMPPVVAQPPIQPVKITQPVRGVYVFDFGQNMAGRALLTLQAKRGQTITLRYGERLAEDGTVDQSKIKVFVYEGPFQTETYIAKGKGTEQWESRFTYHGFRYVQVEGLSQMPSEETLSARPMHTDFEIRGSFECSNKTFNDICAITDWAYKSNFLGYPTDCPHREKNGWTGDAQLAGEMAMLMYRNAASYEIWLNSWDDCQKEDGDLPGIVPTFDWGYSIGTAWDGAYFLLPYYLWLYDGETRPLTSHLPGYRRYLDFLASREQQGIIRYGLGDWVPADTVTPAEVTSTGYYAEAARIAALGFRLDGNEAEARKCEELAERIKMAYRREFVRSDGSVANNSQAALSSALFFSILSPEDAAKTAAKLSEAVRTRNDHLDVGFLGAKFLWRTLSDYGYHGQAYRAAIQTDYPSYGEWLKKGATTLFESWKGEYSLNHVAFGDIVGWFVSYLAGIRPDPKGPGFARFAIKPYPVADLSWTKANVKTVRGQVASSWTWRGGTFALKATVPPNCQATIWVPTSNAESVREVGGAEPIAREADWVVYEVGSGDYEFRSALNRD